VPPPPNWRLEIVSSLSYPPGVKRFAISLWNSLIKAQRGILIACASFVTVLVFTEIWMRYILHYPGMEVEEIATLVAFWLYLVGAVYGSYERTHIKTELMHLIFKKPRHYAWVRVFTSTLTLTLALIMCYWATDYFIWGITRGEVSRVLRWPMVYSQSSLLVGAVFMSFYFLIELIAYFRQALGKTPVIIPYQEE